MSSRTIAALTAATAAVAASLTVATAGAEPSTPSIETLSGAVVLSGFADGAFSAGDDGSVRVSVGGTPVATLPARFTVDGIAHRIDTRIDDGGRTLTLTPDIAVRPAASAMENQLALNDFATVMSRGPVIGTVVGTVLGALVGAAVGASTCLVVGPGCLATIPAAVLAFAGAGGVAGTVLVGGGALAAGLWNYLTVLQAPPGQSSYAGQGGMLDPNGTGAPDAQLQLPSGSANGLGAGSASGSGG
ncbi:hypothetical protein [Nocardia africana]|uniref:DUF8020 domain-containing protein n=1 Tax=Nocardia africana TaxID=134964 RepID=A0A378X5G2_9NOCA|nr:hypothetical protein [Nocardia africana]MCC3317261.1 hypothetical protein [Nocardia africana]SUA47994.1 Uncharacterised protein [Nocardia africana]